MPDATSKPRLTQTSTALRLTCGVKHRVHAPAAKLWALLTNAREFPRWNTTVTSIDGDIALGQKLALRVPISDRTFSLKVSTFEAPSRMVWRDGFAPMFQGVRTFTLVEGGTPEAPWTDFEMEEVFSGLMLPLIKGSLPDFGPAFEQYASDLAKEAERNGS